MRAQNSFFLLLVIGLLTVSIQGHHQGSHTHSPTLGPNNQVTYGSLIKLKHLTTSFWLHSHDIRIMRGGIFSVTAYAQDDHGSYWQVLEEYDSLKKTKTYRDPLRCGDSIILYSTIANYYLRTEDTTFGLTTELLPLVHGIKNDQLDHGVVWKIHCVEKENKEEIYFTDKVRLKHDTSGKYVSTDGSSYYTQGNCGRGCQIAGQLELHAIDNGLDREDTIFEVLGGLTFDTNSETQGEE